jgi:hypothetical protein
MEKSTWVSPEDREIQRASAMRDRMTTRKPVILDPRERKIGIDLQAIQRQVEERRQREAREKARADAFDHQTLEQQRLLLEGMEHERRQRRQVAENDDLFRTTKQKPSQSREYDIWRKDLLQISQPARLGDEDPRLGISAGQIFQGEDLRISERLAMQATQRTEWNREQAREKAAIRRAQEIEDLKDQVIELETQKTLTELDAATEASKAAIRRQLAEDNIRKFQEKRAKEAEDHAVDQEMNDAELRSNARSHVISEVMEPRGVHPMEYRGMTVAEQKSVIDDQADQMRANERAREEERQKELQWEEYLAYLRAQGDLNEAEWRRKNLQEQADLYQTHLGQETEFKDRQRYLNREVYGNNDPEESFYDSWAKDVR